MLIIIMDLLLEFTQILFLRYGAQKLSLGLLLYYHLMPKQTKKLQKLRKSLYERFYKVFTDFTNNYVEFSQLESNTM